MAAASTSLWPIPMAYPYGPIPMDYPYGPVPMAVLCPWLIRMAYPYVLILTAYPIPTLRDYCEFTLTFESQIVHAIVGLFAIYPMHYRACAAAAPQL